MNAVAMLRRRSLMPSNSGKKGVPTKSRRQSRVFKALENTARRLDCVPDVYAALKILEQ